MKAQSRIFILILAVALGGVFAYAGKPGKVAAASPSGSMGRFESSSFPDETEADSPLAAMALGVILPGSTNAEVVDSLGKAVAEPLSNLGLVPVPLEERKGARGRGGAVGSWIGLERTAVFRPKNADACKKLMEGIVVLGSRNLGRITNGEILDLLVCMSPGKIEFGRRGAQTEVTCMVRLIGRYTQNGRSHTNWVEINSHGLQKTVMEEIRNGGSR